MRGLRTLYLLGWVLIPGYWTLRGPEEVMYYEGESLYVQCHYDKWLKRKTKFWCKGSFLTLCSSLLIKSSSGDLVKDDRVSIRDNKKESYFEITMDKLKQEDSDTYQCGIERGALNDRHYIRVEVSPDPKKTSTTEELFTSTATIAVAKSNPTPPPSQGSKEQKLYILIYCIIPLFLLLLAAAVVLLINSKKKKKGWNSKKEKKPQSMVLALNKVDAGSEHRIPGHHLGTDGTEFYSNVEVNPGNNYEELPSQEKSSDRSDEVSYATLNISDPQQLSVYANVGPVLSKIQEIFYTEVAIKPKE